MSSSTAPGTVRAAVIDFGGFLGVGSRKIVVDWNALHFGRVANKSDSITLELTKEQVTAAPEYKEDTPIVVLGAAGSLQPCDLTSIRQERTFWSRAHSIAIERDEWRPPARRGRRRQWLCRPQCRTAS